MFSEMLNLLYQQYLKNKKCKNYNQDRQSYIHSSVRWVVNN